MRAAPSANPGDSVEKRRRSSALHQSSFELTDMSKIVSLAKRRGIIFQTSEIYGGFGNSYDYGPLGVLLKDNIKAAWWRAMVQERDDIVGLDSAIIMHPRVWE